MTTGSVKETSGRPSSSYVPKYESYNSETFNRSQDNKGYYNYGHGLYGDRTEDKKFDHDYFGNAQRFKDNEKKKETPEVNIPDRQPPPQPIKSEPLKVNNIVNNPPVPGNSKFASITQSLMRKKKKIQEVRPEEPQ